MENNKRKINEERIEEIENELKGDISMEEKLSLLEEYELELMLKLSYSLQESMDNKAKKIEAILKEIKNY